MGVGNLRRSRTPSSTAHKHEQRQDSGGIDTIHTLKSYQHSRCGDTIDGSTAHGALCADVRASDRGKSATDAAPLAKSQKTFFRVDAKVKKKGRGARGRQGRVPSRVVGGSHVVVVVVER